MTASATSTSTSTDEANTLTLDRRRSDRRSGEENQPIRPKKARRRHIDPTTCERDYTGQEVEFMRAMDDYKQDSGRMFPTCSEVLEVLRSLGYVQLDDDQFAQLGLEVEFDDVDSDAETEEESL